MNFFGLKVGDRVDRIMGHGGPTMHMQVTKVNEDLVHCGHVTEDGEVMDLGWTFDRASGAEVDEDLQWGPKYGRTGTYLRHVFGE